VVKSGTMRALILLHRWLGVSFSLLFAMWFSTGIVMHFVPFPGLPDPTARVGLIRLDFWPYRLTPRTPADSVAADGPPSWEVKREAGASSLNAGAAPATVSDEPQAGATGNSREGG